MKNILKNFQSTCDQRSPCPITNVLDLVGDKWTLIIIRDMLFFGKTQYKELADSAEKIPTNILADRLKRLEAAGILTKSPYQENPVRYQYSLTRKGMELYPILMEIIYWGTKYLPGVPKENPEFLKGLKRQVQAQIKKMAV